MDGALTKWLDQQCTGLLGGGEASCVDDLTFSIYYILIYFGIYFSEQDFNRFKFKSDFFLT